MGFGVSALLTLRVLSPRETLPVQVVFSLLSVALLCAGFAVAGAVGAAWGLACGSGAKALAAWVRVGRLRQRGATAHRGGTRDRRPRGSARLTDPGRGPGPGAWPCPVAHRSRAGRCPAGRGGRPCRVAGAGSRGRGLTEAAASVRDGRRRPPRGAAAGYRPTRSRRGAGAVSAGPPWGPGGGWR